MALFAELVLYCGLGFLLVKLAVRDDGMNCLYFYPEAYQTAAFSKGLADKDSTHNKGIAFVTIYILIMAVALLIIVAMWNKVTDYWTGYFQVALLMVVMNWFDGIGMDTIWVGRSNIWNVPEMKGVPYKKPLKQLIIKRLAATVLYLIIAFPMAWVTIALAKML